MSTLTISKKQTGFYEKAVVAALCKMTNGFMQLSLPNGEIMQIGNEKAAFKATMHIKDAAFLNR